MKSKVDMWQEISYELLCGCPEEALADHQSLSEMILAGATREEILRSEPASRWPETYVWLKNNLR